MRRVARLACYVAITLWSVGAEDRCVYEGTAGDAVTRLPLARVSIRLLASDGHAGYSGVTNSAGGFHFEGLEAGDYNLDFAVAGYLARRNAKLHVAPGQTVDKSELWLTPESGVAGRVLGPDGEALRGARVILIARKWWNGKRVYQEVNRTQAGHDGAYHLTGLETGGYLVYAVRPREGALAYSILEGPGKPEMRIAARYYPDAARLEGAAPVEVAAGQEVTGIDVHLPLLPVFHARGRSPAEKLSIQLAERNGDQALQWTAETAVTGKDGSFDIAGVLPGDYLLYSSLELVEPGRSERQVSPKVPVTVKGQDAAGLLAPAVTRFELKGRVRLEDGDATSAIPVDIFCDSEDPAYNRFQGAMPKADGSFAMTALPAGRYMLRVVERRAESGLYVKAVRARGSVLRSTEIDLTQGPADDVEVVLSTAVGSVEGTVTDPAAETTVVLVPEGVPFAGGWPLTSELDSGGRFRMVGLAPGRYRAFAVTGYDGGPWQNAEFQRQMAGRGTAFEVAEKGSARVELTVVPAAVVRQVEERIQ